MFYQLSSVLALCGVVYAKCGLWNWELNFKLYLTLIKIKIEIASLV
jgi:hypothetical protein